jgi:hypothetical protein
MEKIMEALINWLPKIGAGITLVIGLIGLFRPRMILDTMNIELQSPVAFSEARAVFGGLNLGMAVAAFALGEPVIFTALGITWATLTLSRFWSMAVDGIGFKASIPALVVDGTICFLFLSPHLLG